MELLLETDRLCVRYGSGEEAICSANIRLHQGDRVAVVGPSGGGKTTLFRALEGSVPSTGKLFRAGRVGLVYQDLRLVSEATALANVCHGACESLGAGGGLLRFPREVEERALALLEEVGLRDLALRRVSTLSGGQRQRVAIARTLCANPAVLLADEPLAALDRENARRILQLLEKLQAHYGFALVVSLHHPELTEGWFQRTWLVADGTVREVSPEDAAARTDGDAGLAQDRAPDASHRWPAAAWGAITLLLVGALTASIHSVAKHVPPLKAMGEGLYSFLRALAPEGANGWGDLPWATLFGSLLETIQMAVVGTALGMLLSFPLALLAMAGPIRWLMRLLLNVIRTIPSIIWALLFVAIVGLGPASGVLALAAYSVGYLTKMYYEGLEDADGRAASALRGLGASPLQAFLFATFPAARPSLAASSFFVFEYNIRGASVLGVVGAGGIGQNLVYYIDYRQFPAAIAGLLLILVVVVALDTVSQAWRRNLTRQRGT
jgi:phosphonate transport system permease protein